MSKANDQRILELRKKIGEKKQKLGKSAKFNPITNCSLELDGQRYNLHSLNKELLLHLMIKVNMLKMSSMDLGVDKDYLIAGFSPQDWIADIQSRLSVISELEERKTLKAMENKLGKLLSEDKKVELEIDDIESLLKEREV